ncbi:ClpP/crotonase-like domain-containing protein [Microdochium trichocladiopsis]|uniref:ClpP/crotonase-like domain-containing protein n=1 Tax=Microdochium trichocladiopsis TaxID=1682393 RepID=A0A9P9BUK2_9PEZI|nr:ClpP/crotonase-like domain-containing protein [Microdochium trichocladiopsis]KAH7037721.1 ClpP/crotonase-like domain-containing protein [Microdochium trichocladiopsis]
MADVIQVAYSGRIATITISNEKKLNALNSDGYYALAKAMKEIAERDDIYITVLTGKGRYFSAGKDLTDSKPKPKNSGADVGSFGGSNAPPPNAEVYRTYLSGFVSNNLNIARAFYTHPKILVVALNGPAVGLSAALTGFADFVYAVPSTFLLTPFTSLGLVAEGGASHAFVQRLGIAKANEALIMSKRIPCDELVAVGYVNKVFPPENFLRDVYSEIDDRLGSHLIGSSLTGIKALIRAPERDILDKQNVQEVFAGLDRFVKGIPQKEFAAIASGKKRHKL